MKKIFSLILLIGCLSLTAYANDAFIVRNIQINGLQGIPRSTVLSYVPVKIGDRIDADKSDQIIHQLFKTGFFSNVSLARKNGTLIINLQQRPIIGQIKITGNKLIPTKKLRQTLKKIGFSEGLVFNRSVLTKIKASLVREYVSVAKYNAKINMQIKMQKRHRVFIHVAISEGKTAKIFAIKIIGNRTFKETTLLHQFKLSPTHLFSFFTRNDQYSSEKLNADLGSLLSYYMNRGYIKFKVLSTQISLTPDRKHIYITVHIHEGGSYHISGYTVTGKTIIPKSEVVSSIQKYIKTGAIFSRKDLIQTYKDISQKLGTKGYAHAIVNAIPKINDNTHTVSLNFVIRPGRRIYVRRIIFSGNYRTNDDAFRRELRQMEGGLLIPRNVNESKRNLLNLPYVQNVEVATKPVPNKPDQVDMTYKITGMSAATLQGGVGYSQIDKFSINGSITQKNLLGTGNWLSLTAFYSQPQISLNLTYYNPYITPSHIGRSVHVYATKFNASKANITDYTDDTYGAMVSYDFPLSEYQTLSLGYGLEHDSLNFGNNPSRELVSFRDKHGKHFNQGQLNASWAYQNFDRYLFPTSGSMLSTGATATVPISKNRSLEYYKVDLSGTHYQPIYKQFIGKLRAHAGYGNGYGKFKTLPFFKNYYAGGIGTVRGYEGNSLGPKDSNGQTIGGKFIVDGTVGLIFPNPIGPTVRTTLFVDAGNVYSKVSLLHLRCSTGLEVDWKSPLGVLNFSFAKALNKRKGDDTEVFQFSIGTTF